MPPCAAAVRRVLFAVLLAGASAVALGAQPGQPARRAPAPRAEPAEIEGFSTERLARLRRTMQGFVDRRELAGLVTLVMRNGAVVDLSPYGTERPEGPAMRADAIFRIASMTKLVTSVAAMMLVEDGRLALGDPLSKFVPEFATVRVVEGPGYTVPADRRITVRDLLTHRSGLVYGFSDPGLVGDRYRELGVTDGLGAHPDRLLADNVVLLARAPLAHQPGRKFTYGLSTDVLGRVVEVASGQPLDAFFQERIFGPLKMVDTGFSVPDAKRARLVAAWTWENDALRPMKDAEVFSEGRLVYSTDAYYAPTKRYFSGGAGLVSTAADYARLLQALLDGGELDGVRLLGPKTLQLMTTSHTHDLPGIGDDGTEFGLGVAITTNLRATQRLGSPGEYAWSGIYGTAFWVDPAEKIVAVLMAQRWPNAPAESAFRQQVYQALVRSNLGPSLVARPGGVGAAR